MNELLSLLLALLLFLMVYSDDINKTKYKNEVDSNSKKYEQEINLYNKFLKEYAKYVKSLELSETEMILKVIKDIWSDIDGYGKCDDLILGYERLAFQEEGKGVCSSFADDFTARINAINPEYDAKNIYVYLNDLEDGKTMERIDFERKNLEQYSNIDEETLKTQNKYGNHMVSVMELKDKNLYLVVDPTNLLIGVLKDGEIDILNTNDDNLMDYKLESNNIFSLDSEEEIKKDYEDTFEDPTITLEEIENLYGIDAQEEAFDKINEVDNNIKRLVKLKKN